MDEIILSNRLKILRAERDLTQEALAQGIGVTRKSINAIEKKRMVPSVVMALKLAEYFQVPVEEIFALK